MTPTDIRNMSWEEIRSRVHGDREQVWIRLHRFPGVTTRGLASHMNWDILRVRPRVTELVQLGLARIDGSIGREGTYRALDWREARIAWEAGRRTVQTEMAL